jgi:hypothetical protein
MYTNDLIESFKVIAEIPGAEVTRQSIELIGPAPLEARSRFYNPNVDQP